jgi:hypothetical protein
LKSKDLTIPLQRSGCTNPVFCPVDPQHPITRNVSHYTQC